MLNKDSFIKFMHKAASIRETRDVCKLPYTGSSPAGGPVLPDPPI